jgi:type VI secretion system protein ImpG
MKDPLLDFYERELGFIRSEAREFASRYPKIAGRLRLSDAETIEDPHVSRLIEAFALLCARLRIKMEDEFPEICQSLLHALYPQYVAPTPPTAICQLSLTDLAADSPVGRFYPRGERLEADEINGVQCNFRLCYDTTLLPLSIVSSEYLEQPLPFQVEPSWRDEVQAAIKIRLASMTDKLTLQQIKVETLRLYLHGSMVLGNDLYEAIMRDTVGVAIYRPKEARGAALPSSVITAVGFSENEGLIPHDPRTIAAYRALWDYFVLPEKYRFVDVNVGSLWNQATGDDYVDLVLLLRHPHSIVRRDMRRDSIRLGCSPVINLFENHCEPLRLTGNQAEYRVIPNARMPQGMEVIAIESVSATGPGGEDQLKFKPFFLPSHHRQSNEQELYWHSSRRRRMSEDSEGDRGTEVYLTLVDLQSQAVSLDEWTLHVTATCCNRDMVSRLPFGGGEPKLTLRTGGTTVSIEMLTPPTGTCRHLSSDDYYWRLLSHLALNQLSLQDNDSGAESLREILRLYDPSGTDENSLAIQAIQSVKYQRSVGRVASNFGTGFCRGIDIDVVVDEEKLVGMGSYLFASVLDHFLSLYASINSFTRLTVFTLANNQPLYRGRPRTGNRFLM